MSAYATIILDSAKADLLTQYPAIAVNERKVPEHHDPDPGEEFNICILDAETVENVWINKVIVTYPLLISYCRTSVNPDWDEVAAVRDKRETVRKLICQNAFGWNAAINDVDCFPEEPYRVVEGEKAHTYSDLLFKIEVLESRILS